MSFILPRCRGCRRRSRQASTYKVTFLRPAPNDVVDEPMAKLLNYPDVHSFHNDAELLRTAVDRDIHALPAADGGENRNLHAVHHGRRQSA